jgi:hypothetical protein
MEPEDSLPSLQEKATGVSILPKFSRVSTLKTYFFNIPF